LENNRNYIGIELNPEYLQIAKDRIGPIEKHNVMHCDNSVDVPLLDDKITHIVGQQLEMDME
jgi:hypothetical protein